MRETVSQSLVHQGGVSNLPCFHILGLLLWYRRLRKAVSRCLFYRHPIVSCPSLDLAKLCFCFLCAPFPTVCGNLRPRKGVQMFPQVRFRSYNMELRLPPRLRPFLTDSYDFLRTGCAQRIESHAILCAVHSVLKPLKHTLKLRRICYDFEHRVLHPVAIVVKDRGDSMWQFLFPAVAPGSTSHKAGTLRSSSHVMISSSSSRHHSRSAVVAQVVVSRISTPMSPSPWTTRI